MIHAISGLVASQQINASMAFQFSATSRGYEFYPQLSKNISLCADETALYYFGPVSANSGFNIFGIAGYHTPSVCIPEDQRQFVTLKADPHGYRNPNRIRATLQAPIDNPCKLPIEVLDPPTPSVSRSAYSGLKSGALFSAPTIVREVLIYKGAQPQQANLAQYGLTFAMITANPNSWAGLGVSMAVQKILKSQEYSDKTAKISGALSGFAFSLWYVSVDTLSDAFHCAVQFTASWLTSEAVNELAPRIQRGFSN